MDHFRKDSMVIAAFLSKQVSYRLLALHFNMRLEYGENYY